MAGNPSDGVGGGLPPQDAGNTGQYLQTTTTGSTSSCAWAAVAGGSITVGAFGASPTANGATAAGDTLTLQPADGTHPGGVSIGTQAFGGAKEFAATATFDLGIDVLGAPVGNGSGVSLGSLTASYASIWLAQGAVTNVNWNIRAHTGGDLELAPGNGGNVVIENTAAVPIWRFIGSTHNLVSIYGTVVLPYNDGSGSPGTTATSNTPSGRLALSTGGNNIVVTCAAITNANCIVEIIPEQIDGTAPLWSCVNNGSSTFTVTLSSVAGAATAPGATWKFKYVVLNGQ